MSRFYTATPNDCVQYLPIKAFAVLLFCFAGRNCEVLSLVHGDLQLIKDEKTKEQMNVVSYGGSKQRA